MERDLINSTLPLAKVRKTIYENKTFQIYLFFISTFSKRHYLSKYKAMYYLYKISIKVFGKKTSICLAIKEKERTFALAIQKGM
jgi:hypothetical protein